MKNVVQASVLSLFVAASMASAQTGPLANGYIYTYAGDGVPGYSGDGGPATSAGLFQPSDAALDAAGNIYIADTYNNRIRKVEAATGMIATIAGNGTQGYSGDGGPATSAEFCLPSGIVLDAAGNLYIADWCNNRIRKVDALTGIITTFAGGGVGGDGGPATNAGIEAPFSPALDSSGNLYFGDLGNDRVRKVDAATGIITTVAGDGIFGYSGDGGPATSAELYFPYGVALDPAGNLYIADTYNSRVRKVAAATGIITTIAGNGIQGYGGDGGPAINAELWSPWAVTLDTSGNLYFADANNNRVRLVNAATGIITTYAGDGTEGFSGDGGPAVDAALSEPAGLALDAKGSLYIADPDNSRIRVVRQGTLVATTTTLIAVPTTLTVGQTLTLTATVTAASGSGPAGSVLFYDGTVPLGTANLNSSGVATLTLTPAAGSYSITASYGGSSSDAPSQSAPPVSVTVNGIATATSLSASATDLTFGQPLTLTATVTPASGAVPAGTVTFFNGAASLGSAALNAGAVATLTLTPAAGSYSITASYGGSATDDASISSVVQVIVSGSSPNSPNIYTYAGNGIHGFSGDGGPALSAELWWPSGEAIDSAGNLYFADVVNCAIRKVAAATGIITTISGDGKVGYQGDGGPAIDAEFSSPQGVTLDAAGNIYIPDDLNNRVRKIDAVTGLITTVAGNGTPGYGGDGGPATAAELHFVTGVVSDAAGDLYISDLDNNRIRRVDAATGIITTVAGNGGFGFSGDGGPAANATVWAPYGVGLDGAGNLYIMDNGNNRLRKVDKTTGIITTVAGNGTQGYGGDGGPATSASLNSPYGDVVVDSAGDVYFEDSLNNRIRRVDGTTGTISTFAGDGVAGYGGDGGPANLAELQSPSGVVQDSSGNLYVADTFNMRIRIVGALSIPSLVATTTTLTASATTLTFGQTLTLTATVAAASGGTPTGTVTFLNGTTSLGTAPLNGSGVGSLVLTPPVGVYSLTASYGGSSSDSASVSSPPITVTVISTATTTTLTPSLNPAPFGASVTFTAAVVTSAGIPAGTVSFYDGPSLLATSTLASGAATYSTSSLSVGLHNMTAVYAGAVGYSPSTSNTLAEVISAADFSISAAPGSQSVYTGEAASYAVAVTPGTGFDLPVALSCSQLPANTTCTFSPATVTGGSGSSALMVQTTAPSPPAAAFVFSTKIRVTALAGLLLLFIPRRLRRRIGRPMLLLIFALLAVGAAMAGCSAPGLLTGGTPVGAQTITLTGAATNGSQTLTHATTMTLNVKSLF